MKYHPDFLLHQAAVNGAVPVSSMVARLQTDNWERHAPRKVLLKVFEDVEVLRECLPYLRPETLGSLMPHLSNEARLVVLGHTTRAVVMNGLADATDMSPEVLEVFAEKAGKVACRNFLGAASSHLAGIYPDSADATYEIWFQMLTRNKTLAEGVPANWSRDHIRKAFDYVTELHQDHGDPHDAVGFGELVQLWRTAEIAEVVTEDQRLYWHKHSRVMIGPLSFYTERNLESSLEVTPRRGVGTMNSHAIGVIHYGDVDSLFQTPSLPLRTRSNETWLIPVLKWSPRRNQIIDHVDKERLLGLLALGVTLDEVLKRVDSVTELFADWYDVNHVAETMSFPEDVIMQMPPTNAFYVASKHQGEFDLNALTERVEEALGSSVMAWQFFWENSPTWSDSLELLLETAAAVS